MQHYYLFVMSGSLKKRTRKSAPNVLSRQSPNEGRPASAPALFEGQVENGVSEQEIETIRSCITNVAKAMGQGRRESVYQNALKVELSLAFQKPCMIEYPFPILYRNERVGVSYIDLLLSGMFFVEVKSTAKLSRKDVLQSMAYARDLNMNGVLVNFLQGTARNLASGSSFEFLVVNGHSVVHNSL